MAYTGPKIQAHFFDKYRAHLVVSLFNRILQKWFNVLCPWVDPYVFYKNMVSFFIWLINLKMFDILFETFLHLSPFIIIQLLLWNSNEHNFWFFIFIHFLTMFFTFFLFFIMGLMPGLQPMSYAMQMNLNELTNGSIWPVKLWAFAGRV